MRHKVAGRLFGRPANQRKALLRGLASALLEHERIETTVAKAKETRKIVERLVTLGKRGDLHAKRTALSKIPNRELIVKLFDVIAPRFADRNGGYLRIIRTRRRVNDRAELAVIEFVDYEENVMSKKAEAEDKKSKKAASKTEKKAESKSDKKAEVKTEAKEEVKTEAKTEAKKKTTAKKKTATKKKAAPAVEKKTVTKKKTTAKKKAVPAKKKEDK
jgi:large subunit ribosomal protein L17